MNKAIREDANTRGNNDNKDGNQKNTERIIGAVVKMSSEKDKRYKRKTE